MSSFRLPPLINLNFPIIIILNHKLLFLFGNRRKVGDLVLCSDKRIMVGITIDVVLTPFEGRAWFIAIES